MKKYFLMIFAALFSLYLPAEESNTTTLAQLLDVLVGAHDGAEKVRAQQEHRAAEPLDPKTVEQVKMLLAHSQQLPNQVKKAINQGNTQQIVQELLRFRENMAPNNAADAAEKEQWRRWARLWDNNLAAWQKKYPKTDLTEATPAQMQDFLASFQGQLAQGSKNEAEASDYLGKLGDILFVANKWINEDLDPEQGKMRDEMQRLKVLAADQGMGTSSPQDLILQLKLRLAEQVLGEKSLSKTQQTQHALSDFMLYHRHEIDPRAPYYAEILKILKQLDDDYAGNYVQWQKLGEK